MPKSQPSALRLTVERVIAPERLCGYCSAYSLIPLGFDGRCNRETLAQQGSPKHPIRRLRTGKAGSPGPRWNRRQYWPTREL